MKRLLTTLVMTFGLGSLFVVAPLPAQSNPGVVDVPFPFAVGGQRLSPGQYNISQLNSNSATFTLRSDRAARFVQLATREQGTPMHPSVTFVRYGSDWVLTRIAPPGSDVAYSIGKEHKSHTMPVAAMVSIAVH